MNIKVGLITAFIIGVTSTFTVHGDQVDANKQSVLRLSEATTSDAVSETFGALFDASLPKVTLSQLTADSSTYADSSFQLETKIAKVCQKKGCFFIAQEGDAVMRVAFKDYAFFIPTDSAGKKVTLAGQLIKKQMTAEQVAHFNQDMQGGSDAIKEGVVYEILASSITIPTV